MGPATSDRDGKAFLVLGSVDRSIALTFSIKISKVIQGSIGLVKTSMFTTNLQGQPGIYASRTFNLKTWIPWDCWKTSLKHSLDCVNILNLKTCCRAVWIQLKRAAPNPLCALAVKTSRKPGTELGISDYIAYRWNLKTFWRAV